MWRARAAVFGIVVSGGLACSPEDARECTTSADCASGERCVDGVCGAGSDGGATRVDGGGGDDGGGVVIDGGGGGTDGGASGTDGGASGTDSGASGTDGGGAVDAGPPDTVTLTLQTVGDGIVRVFGGGVAGSTCGPDDTCLLTFDRGAPVTLSPRAGFGAMACNWIDPPECTFTSSNCDITMDTDKYAYIQFGDMGTLCFL